MFSYELLYNNVTRFNIIKKFIKRVGKGILIYYPRNIYKILVKLYSDLYGTRTNEIIKIIGDRNYGSYLEVGVWHGDNLLPIAKKYSDLISYGVDSYSGSSLRNITRKRLWHW